jgi:hypothetical protein
MANRLNPRTIRITRAAGLVSACLKKPIVRVRRTGLALGGMGALPFLWYPARLALEWDDLCGLASASPQRLFEARGVAMLSQKIVERFVSEFLKGFHAF